MIRLRRVARHPGLRLSLRLLLLALLKLLPSRPPPLLLMVLLRLLLKLYACILWL
eukprot:COSAG01_NODE_146_length_24099_cov_25.341208_18_plen_55_part_00